MGKKWGRIGAFFAIIIAVGILISQTAFDVARSTNLGLDLQGGFEVLYELQPEDGQELTENDIQATASALNQRVDVLGVSEPSITVEGEDRIRVQLPGVEDQEEARELLSTEAELSFRDVDDNLMLSGEDLEQGGASAVFDEQNQPIVQLTLQDGQEFGEITEELYTNPPPENSLVIWLDYEEEEHAFYDEIGEADPAFLSAPSVNEPLYTDTVTIQGGFTLEEAEFLAEVLNAGSLPVQIEEVYSNAVGASLGEQALEETLFAGLVGVSLILLYMMAYYRFMGVIAAITLSVYIYLVMILFNSIQGVLTLPGIAALILGVGMAVDANILTYERIKEELKDGKSMKSAYKAGSRRALGTIIDANVTTIIAAAVLFYFGTSAVQGFAVMLIVSILTSFITAVYGSRLLLGLWINSRSLNRKYWLFGVKERDVRRGL
ncbi:preprotein translocase subunit SecD/SecD/SecF fusion protein [Geomicrobium halophilum]|uniref:Protein translocase subunit SecD n=1 Tax=Geomicrobium halophilum TaxID=549000 RepID=A0A841PYY3_9BACL|nr:protein translocase subunit SecD [Geomicrobium halophilum]MBB6449505.1 preprotein translocase subunit SecD/SecD/SecF fusion protein [Geomicrobium halophilum]